MLPLPGGEQKLHWDWLAKYGDADSLADKLANDRNALSDYTKAPKSPRDGTSYGDVQLVNLFKEIKTQAKVMASCDVRGNTATDAIKKSIDKDREAANSRFEDAKKKLNEICTQKKTLAERTRFNEFNVTLILPNGLEVQKIHLKPVKKESQ